MRTLPPVDVERGGQPAVDEMARAYRAELAKTCPAARDAASFAHAWGTLCAYRALAMLSWLPTGALVEDRPWVDDWTVRAAVLAALSRLRLATRDQPRLAPLAEMAARLQPLLRARWPEIADPLPRWPALAGLG